MKNKLMILVLFVLLMASITACSGEEKLKDGMYEAKSSVDDSGGYAVVKLIIKDGEIDSVEYDSYDKKDNIKDENYGKDTGSDEFYKKAQKAVEGMKSYKKQINEKKKLELVEAVSGATVSYNQFEEAVQKALDLAK